MTGWMAFPMIILSCWGETSPSQLKVLVEVSFSSRALRAPHIRFALSSGLPCDTKSLTQASKFSHFPNGI